MHTNRTLFCLMASLALLGLAGCGSRGPTTYPVSGTVSFDGQPISSGEIIFRSADDQAASSAGNIHEGKFSFASLPGKKRVEIIAVREVPGKFDESNPGEKVPLREMYIPDQYNRQSKLAAEVTPNGANQFDFPLTSKAR